MSIVAMGRKADGTLVELPITAGGKLDTSASVEPAAGGATEAKQDDMIAALAGGLPLALGAGGGVKVDGSGTALPVSAASLPLPTDAATQTTLAALSAKLPAVASPADNMANPSISQVMGMTMGYNASLGQWARARVDSTNFLHVRTNSTTPASASRSTSLQIQRTIASFSCTPKRLSAFCNAAGWIAFFNASSAVADAAVPYGGHIYRVEANQTLTFTWTYNESFTTGFVVAHLSQVTSGGALATVISTTAACMFTGQYD